MNIHFDTVSTAVSYYIQIRTNWLEIRDLANLSVLLNVQTMGHVQDYLEQFVKSKLSEEDMQFLFEYINKEEHSPEESIREDEIIFEKIDPLLKEAFKVDPLKRRSWAYGGVLHPGMGYFDAKPLVAKNIPYTLEQLQKFVGGYIQIIRLSDELVMVIDEDGKLKDDQQINQFATLLARSYGAIERDFIVGSAFICYSKYID